MSILQLTFGRFYETIIMEVTMGKGHRDNHTARMRRGPVAFEKKAIRRKPLNRCLLCGFNYRSKDGVVGLCLRCQ